MCGRYALAVRPSFIRNRLQQQGHQVDDAPDDDEVRETYNFPPGSYGAIYRADIPDQGAFVPEEATEGEEVSEKDKSLDHGEERREKQAKYKLQAMKWGLVPFWTKRAPGYGSLMKTINCRDDSLMENRGLWTPMKKKKRCIVVCQGFYEWLKSGPSGKERSPYFIRRKDGDLMYLAGLWDCVKYEGSDESLYTYTVITTSSNASLSFLHDRMPVIIDPGSTAMSVWLDPHRTTWTKELQSILKPYDGELDVYPVSKDVGKVGNNSPDFIVPIDSKENKTNIANFFSNVNKSSKDKPKQGASKLNKPVDISQKQSQFDDALKEGGMVKAEERSNIKMEDHGDESKNLLQKPGAAESQSKLGDSFKRAHSQDGKDEQSEDDFKPTKMAKIESSQEASTTSSRPTKGAGSSTIGRKMHSATSNDTASKSTGAKKPSHGTQRITNFFKK